MSAGPNGGPSTGPSGERRLVVLPTYLDEEGILTCPKCGCQDFEVTHSYPWAEGVKRRRRVCGHCGWPITTMETISESG